MTDMALLHLAYSTSLATLNMRGCGAITDAGLSCLASSGRASRLSSINVRACPHVTGEGIKALASGLSRLRLVEYGDRPTSRRRYSTRTLHPGTLRLPPPDDSDSSDDSSSGDGDTESAGGGGDGDGNDTSDGSYTDADDDE